MMHIKSDISFIDDKIKKVSDETDTKIQDAIKSYDAQLQPTEVVVGAHPKKQHKNKFIQWILIKLFGYELEYKTVMAKTIVIKPSDETIYFRSLYPHCDGCPHLESCVDTELNKSTYDCEYWGEFKRASIWAEKRIQEMLYEELTKYIKEEPLIETLDR